MLTASTQRKMVAALQIDSVDDDELQPSPNRISMTAVNASAVDLEHFVTRRTHAFFVKLRLSTDFLSSDPEIWETRDDYKETCEIINRLHVTNDNAQSGVALI